MVFGFYLSEELGVGDGVMGVGAALVDDGDFFGGDVEVGEDFVVGVLRDGDDAGGAAEVEFGEVIEIAAFEG